MSLRSGHLDRILGRLEDLDTANLTVLVQRLARERGLLEAVLSIMQEGVLVIDPDGRIGYANEAACRLIGIREEDIGVSTLWKLVPELVRTLVFRHEELVLESSVLSREIELTYPEHRIARLYMVPIDAGAGVGQVSGEDRRIAVILTDVTEEKISTEELIENEKISSIVLLAAGVAHELGNPLNSMNIHLQLMERRLAAIEDQELAASLSRSLEVCGKEIKRLDSIIRHFLEAIRPKPPDFADLNLIDVLEEVLAFLSDELTSLGVEVDVHLEGGVPVVLGDRDQIKQVFFNLIHNAMEAMDSGGKLEISSRSDDDYYFLLFADTGVGIDEEELSRVFEPYFSTKESGHGLGMMIVQRILRAHGGQIGIDSRRDTGTVVSLQFPQKDRRARMLEHRPGK